MNAIEFENVGKQYRLGLVSTGTISHDLNRWWTMNVRGKEDPYLKIGETNDRAHKGESDYVWALKDINFKIEEGDVVGIIGKNGAGKSTLLKLLSRVTAPTTGRIIANGRIASLLEVGTGFHPEMTGRENIYMNGAIMGMTKQEISRKLDEIIDFSGCERYIDTPVKRYSSGMTVRLGFAIAAHLEPEILVVDEVLAVGDAEFQKKAIGKMQDVSRGGGRTVLFVSHNMASVRLLCSRGVVLENGQVAFDGGVNDAISYYIKDDKNRGVRIIDGLKYNDTCLKITRFIVNEGELNEVFISPQNNTLHVLIEGILERKQHLALEGRLYDQYGSLVALYSPGHVLGLNNVYNEGNVRMEYRIEFPATMTKGVFRMEMGITHPNVCSFVSLTIPIIIISSGIVAANGRTFNYADCGLIMLDSK